MSDLDFFRDKLSKEDFQKLIKLIHDEWQNGYIKGARDVKQLMKMYLTLKRCRWIMKTLESTPDLSFDLRWEWLPSLKRLIKYLWDEEL